MLMESVSAWLASTSISQFIANTFWIVPVVQSIHILAIGILLASNAMLDLRLAGFIGREQSVRDLALRFYPWIWGALGVLLTTGIIMILSEPGRELLNWIFWTKMGLILVAVGLVVPVRSLLKDCPYEELPPDNRAIIRLCAMLSLVVLVLIVTCGRWIAYAGGKLV